MKKTMKKGKGGTYSSSKESKSQIAWFSRKTLLNIYWREMKIHKRTGGTCFCRTERKWQIAVVFAKEASEKLSAKT